MADSTSLLARQSAAFVWSDRALFVGDRSETARHSHHATEVSVALDDLGIDIAGADENFSGVPGAMVRAGVEHRLSIPGPKVAVLYVDPQSDIAAPLHEWLGDDGIRPLPSAKVSQTREQMLDILRDARLGLSDAERSCETLLAHFAERGLRPAVDHRVRRAMERIEAELDHPPALDELARDLRISSSHLRHMFREQVGVPISRYVLWMRLRAALVEALGGQSMATAAQAAGFADAAHFTRTCRQMFGLPPTAFAPVDSVFVA